MKTEIKILFLFFLLFILLTKTISIASHSNSLLITIESLVEKQTFVIDNSPFKNTQDRALIGGHYYCLPPTLPFISAPVYFTLSKFFGITLARNPHLCIYLMTLLIVGTSACLLLVYFYKSLQFTGIKSRHKLLLTASLGLGTLVFPYSTVFNRHIVAAAFLFFTFYLLLSSKFLERNIRRNIFLSGFFAALALSIDNLPSGILLVLFLIYILANKSLRSCFIYYMAGALISLVLYGGLLIHITGGIKPINLHPEYFQWTNSPWKADWIGTSALSAHADMRSFSLYSFQALFGKRGIFSYTPLLLFSLILLIRITVSQKHIFKKEAVLILIAFLGGIGSLLISLKTFGGSCYGWRYSISLVPLCFFFSAFFFEKKRSPLLYGLFALALFISVFVAWTGIYQPWARTFPGDCPFINNLSLMKIQLKTQPASHLLVQFFPFIAGSDISSFSPPYKGLENKVITYHHGQAGDLPVPGDYDGDGTDDLAVFRKGKWDIMNLGTYWHGSSGDIPVPGDYDGNGTVDLAVLRNTRLIISNGEEYTYRDWNDSWIPVPASYSGEKRDEFAAFYNGIWSIYGGHKYGFGSPGDIPAPADIDGDGTTNFAIFRKGLWKISVGKIYW